MNRAIQELTKMALKDNDFELAKVLSEELQALINRIQTYTSKKIKPYEFRFNL